MSLPPWENFFGKKRSWTFRAALETAIREGIKPDPTYQPPYSRRNGESRPEISVHIDIDKEFNGYQPIEQGSMVRAVLRRYVGSTLPDNGRIKNRPMENFEFNDSTARQIAVVAMNRRVTAIDQMAMLIDQAIPRILRNLPKPEESSRVFQVPPEPTAYKEFRVRVLDLGWDPEALIAMEVQKLLNEGAAP